MVSITNFDFATAKLNHLNWRSRLRAYVSGKQGLDESELLSHHECNLGKWIDGAGLAKYGKTAEMKELATVHEKLHRISKDIVEARKAGKTEAAERGLVSLDPLTARIAELLDTMEAKRA